MWTFAIKDNEIQENRLYRVYPKGLPVLIFKKGTSLYSVASNCPHMGCSLGGAAFEGTILQCPCHDWRFDITTGFFIDAPEIRLETYRLKAENGNVYINLEKESV
jgi:nitrite reductase/ring-hydroxylating ferredoxin subunit